jgi:hypothetical protein
MGARLPRRIALLALVTLLLAGCGTRFLYNRMDTLLYLYVANQVSLHSEQRDGLRSALRDFLDWHRQSELPRYANFLRELARDAGQPLGRARIEHARTGIEALWRDSVLRGAPAAVDWLLGLKPAQLDELFASLAEDDEELREEYCESDAGELLHKREKSFGAALRDWIGKPDPQQLALLRRHLAMLEPNGCAWIASRVQYRATLRSAIDRQATGQPDKDMLIQLLVRPEDGWDPHYRARFERNRDVIVSLLTDLDATLDQRQRKRLSDKLDGYARDFERLSRAQQQR